jgi:hypothetical protein
VEVARLARIVGFEQREFLRQSVFHVPVVARLQRYSAAADRSLYRAMTELERLQAARKAQASAEDTANTEPVPPAGKVGDLPSGDTKQSKEMSHTDDDRTAVHARVLRPAALRVSARGVSLRRQRPAARGRNRPFSCQTRKMQFCKTKPTRGPSLGEAEVATRRIASTPGR